MQFFPVLATYPSEHDHSQLLCHCSFQVIETAQLKRDFLGTSYYSVASICFILTKEIEQIRLEVKLYAYIWDLQVRITTKNFRGFSIYKSAKYDYKTLL
jgi:hypothetical protein